MKKALIIVDGQNDFFPGGALGVPFGDEIIPYINLLIAHAVKLDWLIIFTRDWHPRKTKHFKKDGGTWETHCVKNTNGAKFHPDIKMPEHYVLISKGMSTVDDGYSPFEGVDIKGRPLDAVLKEHGITTLYVAGLAKDYCVKACVLDSQKFGYDTVLLNDAVRAVNIHPTDGFEAELLMRAAHAHVTKTQEVCNEKQ